MLELKNYKDKESRTKKILQLLITYLLNSSKIIKISLFFLLALSPFLLSQYRKQIYESFPQVIKDSIRDTYINEIKPKDLPNIPLNFINSLFYKVDKLELHINQKNLDKLRISREEALRKGNLIQSDNDKVKVAIKYGENLYKARLRLKGDIVDHLYGSQWSYRVELEKNKSMLGMRKFSLQTPKTRNYLGEWVFHKLLEYEGLPFLRYKLVNVYLNGKNLGIYSIEEHFDKVTVENNGYREGPIFSLDENRWWLNYSKPIRTISGTLPNARQDEFITRPIKVFELNKTLLNPSLKSLHAYGSKLLDKFINEEMTISDVFEIEKLAKYLAVVDLNGSSHAVDWNNMRLYLNPITKKFIPIGFDSNGGRSIYSLSINNSSLFHEKALLDKNFMRLYIRNLERLSKKSYWNDFITLNSNELKEKNALINKTYPWYEYKNNSNYIIHNQKFIEQALSPDLPLNSYIEEFNDKKLKINVSNKILFPIEIIGVYEGDEILYSPKESYILESRSFDKNNYFSVSMDANSKVAKKDKFDEKFLLGYKIIGTNKINYLKINNFSKNYINNISLNDISKRKDNVRDFPFITKDSKNKILTFKLGSHIISKPLITPKGFKLIVNSSTSITIEDNGLILSNGPINFLGTKDNPIEIKGVKGGQGIYVINANKDSKIEFTNFINLNSGFKDSSNMLGALTFYESDVFMNEVNIDSNNSEDSLNIFRSKFEITNTTFTNTRSDALDIDFGSGKLQNITFINIGNDAIDFSGSNAVLKNISISTVGDKAISIGEKSKVLIEDLKVEKAAIGIASKDLSVIDIKEIDMKSTEVGFTVFQKKPEYGPATINIYNKESLELEIDKLYLLEEPSVFTFNGKGYNPNVDNVEEYLYGNIYGKKTIR